MAKVRLPTVLRPLAGGSAVVDVEARDLASLRGEISSRFPQLAERVYEPDGSFKEFVTVFVDGEDARYLEGGTELKPASEVQLLPAISGG